ncbi:MAG: transcriptional regulator NrdR [Candidatus Thermoplasmatota archaeon]|nr:transcriptional regulator NrdR [Candidatus Thermoplasmatota archaeon]MBS3802468.1 transcriptional regulator NrdR [Candidatus Thermoplasmatota archaeon]
MQCPYCQHENTKVTDSRDTGIYSIRRRRECLSCHRRFTTYEHIEMSPIYIIKKDGRREKYDKSKIKTGIVKALEKRPVSPEQIENLLDTIEEHIRKEGKEEISSTRIGEFVMEELKKIDEVAYIRFASVYRSFADITLFEEEVQKLTNKS